MKKLFEKLKTKIKQTFCRHKKVGFYEKTGPFQCISGKRVYRICEKCGKELGSVFYEFEGRGYK